MIQSWIDKVTHEGLWGWAVDTEDPSYRVPVKCIFNGKLGEVAVSNQRREDLIGPTAARDPFHGLSARVPTHCWSRASTVEVVAIDHTGRDVTIHRGPVPLNRDVITISNGLLTCWFFLNEGGALSALQSSEFPHADNLIDSSQPYGRAIQIDLYENGNNDPLQANPTEGGWMTDDPFGGGSKVISYKVDSAKNIFTCVSKMREWNSGDTTEWSLIRNTWLDGRSVVSRFMLLNGYQTAQRPVISYDWILNPSLFNAYMRYSGDQTWPQDPWFTQCKNRVATVYDLFEGEKGMAMSFGVGSATNKFFYAADTIANGVPRCAFFGWRLFDLTLEPQKSFSGWQVTSVARGVDQSRIECEAAMTRAEVP